ncbi:MAG: immunity 52 family protein [Bacteroidales bacterium]|nr:immunity 52 family protein [Bacteroidales bacterium]
MKLLLKAFGQSEKYTIRERAELLMDFHKLISEKLGHFDWKIYNRKTARINILDYDNSFPAVYTQVKQGLNACAVKPIRYKEDDIAEITSMCNFHNTINDSFGIEYTLGFPSNRFPAFVFGITNMKDQELFTKEKILEIVDLVIKTWKPEMLCVTNPDYFHSISKAPTSKSPKKGIPWSGWFTYVSESIEPKQSEIKMQSLNISRIEMIEGYGKIYWVTEEIFDERNKEHILKALSLEDYFIDNDIIMSSSRIGNAQHVVYCIACRRRDTGYAAYDHPLYAILNT